MNVTQSKTFNQFNCVNYFYKSCEKYTIMSSLHFSCLAPAMCISPDVYAVHRTDNESEERLRYPEENNVSSANAQRVVSIQFVDEGDVTEVFEDHKEVQIDEYETDSDDEE